MVNRPVAVAERPIQTMWDALRCPECGSPLQAVLEGIEVTALTCFRCSERFPVEGGIPRMLLRPLREQILGPSSASTDVRVSTARSFAYEWRNFSQPRPEWQANFLDYMAPHAPEFFRGRKVLDAGCGSGRHAYYSAKFGAEVWAMDLGRAIETAHGNTRDAGSVTAVQADIMRPPFAQASFDFVYSIGVLHHLPDPEAGFRTLLNFVKPGGEIQIYLYWHPEGQPVKAVLLRIVAALRAVTTRMPYWLLHAFSYVFAAAAFGFFVWPYQILRRFAGVSEVGACSRNPESAQADEGSLLKRVPAFSQWVEKLPMKQYALYPFQVCVNDQFDRFSAPIENRYRRADVQAWLERAGLEETFVRANFGWCAGGRKPAAQGAQS